jgi:hypothetical protein
MNYLKLFGFNIYHCSISGDGLETIRLSPSVSNFNAFEFIWEIVKTRIVEKCLSKCC